MEIIAGDSHDGRTKLLDRLREIRRDREDPERIARVGRRTLDPRSGEATRSPGMYRILGRDANGPQVRLEGAITDPVRGLGTGAHDDLPNTVAIVEPIAPVEAWQESMDQAAVERRRTAVAVSP